MRSIHSPPASRSPQGAGMVPFNPAHLVTPQPPARSAPSGWRADLVSLLRIFRP